MVADPYRSSMSVEEYLAYDRSCTDVRYEFIDGQMYMLAGGTANHSIIAANMIRELGILLRGKACRVYTSDMRVKISSRRYVYPDVSVGCDERDRGTDDILQYPRLIVEVLSPSTESYDRSKKFIYYRTCLTIQEYVMVDTRQQAIEVYRRASEHLWTLHLFGPHDTVELASLGVSFSVADIYENVVVPEYAPDDDL